MPAPRSAGQRAPGRRLLPQRYPEVGPPTLRSMPTIRPLLGSNHVLSTARQPPKIGSSILKMPGRAGYFEAYFLAIAGSTGRKPNWASRSGAGSVFVKWMNLFARSLFALDLITAMHAELVESLRLGLSVFLSGSAALGDARRLVARKRQLRRLEAEAATLSLRTLQDGADGTRAITTRVDNSDFLRIIRDLRRVHSHIAALCYPVLEHAGENSDRDTEEAAAQWISADLRL